ncbi:MAG TPA: VOC family protein, partial [Candidatus Binataceae bacterium]|nr:VOC family protein [Candidatus Binataceae bacterium]
MLKGIDHFVVVVPELEAAIASYGELGFTVVRGGKHNIGTHNALIAFADGSYIELIAFLAPVAGHPWYDAMNKSGGLVDFCAQSDDLAGAVAAYRRAGVSITDPNGMTRDRPDGYRLKWVLAIPNAPFNGSLPFLIKDETPRDERVPRERTHRNGVSGLANLIVAVPDAAKVAGWYRIITGSDGEAIEHRE